MLVLLSKRFLTMNDPPRGDQDVQDVDDAVGAEAALGAHLGGAIGVGQRGHECEMISTLIICTR